MVQIGEPIRGSAALALFLHCKRYLHRHRQASGGAGAELEALKRSVQTLEPRPRVPEANAFPKAVGGKLGQPRAIVGHLQTEMPVFAGGPNLNAARLGIRRDPVA